MQNEALIPLRIDVEFDLYDELLVYRRGLAPTSVRTSDSCERRSQSRSPSTTTWLSTVGSSLPTGSCQSRHIGA